MQDASSVVDARCNFYEPFGRTNSWRVLDADNNILPEGNGATYHAAVFLKDDTSAKIGIALGTWVENFATRYELDQPTCTRDLSDFSEEKGPTQEDIFPVVSCPSAEGSVGDAPEVQEVPVCEMGQVCNGSEEECVIAGISYEHPMMVCGGELCPAAVQIWEEINMVVHKGMMDLEYTGNPDIDFVRGMIPHHLGAVEMCHGLIQTLTCTEVEAVDNLEGLVHFCNHVEKEQETEVDLMRVWLSAKNISEYAPCSSDAELSMERQGSNHDGMNMQGDALNPMPGDAMNPMSGMGEMMHGMPSSCGNVTTPSAEKLIELNDKMHGLMKVSLSCDHSVDFVRMMLPHHAGAVDMCDILLETTADDYLIELCDNITITQRAEIAWLYEWLEARDKDPRASCGGSCAMDAPLEPPCEDMLATSSFAMALTGNPTGPAAVTRQLSQLLATTAANQLWWMALDFLSLGSYAKDLVASAPTEIERCGFQVVPTACTICMIMVTTRAWTMMEDLCLLPGPTHSRDTQLSASRSLALW